MSIISKVADMMGLTPYDVTQYMVIFGDSGELVTSLPMERNDTEDTLKTKAEKEYPGKTAVLLPWTDLRDYYRKGYTYDKTTGKPVAPPDPSPEEVQAAALSKLDAEYAALIQAKQDQIIQADTVYQDQTLADQRRKELDVLKAEYIQKRGEL